MTSWRQVAVLFSCSNHKAIEGVIEGLLMEGLFRFTGSHALCGI